MGTTEWIPPSIHDSVWPFRTSSRAKLTNMAKQLYADRGQVTSNPTPFEDVDAIIALKDFARKNSLKTVADLKKPSSFTLAGQAPFKAVSPA